MAATTTVPDTPHRCPIDPELADLLPNLIARHVGIQFVPAELAHLCEDCLRDQPENVADAAVWVAHRAPSEALPEGYTYRHPLCLAHLWAAVAWELRRGCLVWVEVPVAAAVAA